MLPWTDPRRATSASRPHRALNPTAMRDSPTIRPADSGMAAHAYAAIKTRIIDFRYEPGARLSEAQLAKELGLGRSPIRAALAKLKSDGWVAVSPQSGTYIKSLSEKEIADLVDLRLLLESHAAALAARAIDDDALRKLKRAIGAFCPGGVVHVDERAFEDFNELDSLVHLTVYRAAGNTLVKEILSNLLDKVQWLKASARPSASRIQSGYTELRRVVDALDAHDPRAAAARMREHITNAAGFLGQTGMRARRGPERKALATPAPEGSAEVN